MVPPLFGRAAIREKKGRSLLPVTGLIRLPLGRTAFTETARERPSAPALAKSPSSRRGFLSDELVSHPASPGVKQALGGRSAYSSPSKRLSMMFRMITHQRSVVKDEYPRPSKTFAQETWKQPDCRKILSRGIQGPKPPGLQSKLTTGAKIYDFGTSSRIDAGCADDWGVGFAVLFRPFLTEITLRFSEKPAGKAVRRPL